MIAFLRGVVAEKSPQLAVIEVGGVGYRVFITLGGFEKLPDPGGETVLPTVTIVREDALVLYGFADRNEKEMFLKLITVTRIGPKLACAILSGIKADALRNAIVHADKTGLAKIPGVGAKTAERIIMELKDKFGPQAIHQEGGIGSASPVADAVAALVNLGYQRSHAEKVVSQVVGEGSAADLGGIIRKSLRILSL